MDCPSQCKKYPEKKQAKLQDLDRIIFTIRDNSFPDISNKASATLALFISLARLDYTGISAPVGAIQRTIQRNGYHLSDRTLYRALSELESLGFFTRSKYRVGHDKFETSIAFNSKRFEFWTRKTPVLKQPTQAHISSSLPNCQESPRTKNNLRVNSSNSTDKYISKPRVRASGKKNWRHPVLYSLLCVLLKTKNRDRALILSRARLEIEAERSSVTLAGRSGVEWNRPSWQDMPYYQREKIVIDEILPLLSDKGTMEPRENIIEELTEALSMPDFNLDSDRRESSVQVQLPLETRPAPPPNCLDSDELRILRAAAERHRQRSAGY